MQYTANKPFNSVLIIHQDGIRYRLKEDHLFKNIRYAQITTIKLKADLIFFYRLILIPLGILSHSMILYLEGYSIIVLLNLIFWLVWGGRSLFQKRDYKLEINKGPLISEVFITKHKKEAQQIRKEIESRL